MQKWIKWMKQNIQSVLKKKKSEKKHKTNAKLQKNMNPMPSEFKGWYLFAEKFTTDKKFINHRLCMHSTVVIQMPFV